MCSALVVLGGAVSCEKEESVVDFPTVGPLTFSGTYDLYFHGSQGWVEEDRLGIFVTSDGLTQSNLEYAPVEFSILEESEHVPGFFLYGDPVPTTTFKAVAGEVGFKKGPHYVYAYTPYDAASLDYKTVKLPDLAVQEYSSAIFRPEFKYGFAHAKLTWPIKKYTPEATSFGSFVSPYTQITIPSPQIKNKELFKGGEKIEKIVLSSTIDLAVTDATINLESGVVKGNFQKSIEVSFEKAEAKVDYSDFLGASFPTFYLVTSADPAEALTAEYTLTAVVDGKEYSSKGVPSKMATADNINLWNSFTIE